MVSVVVCVASGSARADSAISVFPSPGSQYDLPSTQITFRGTPASLIGSVEVLGSVTGVHAGHVEADFDGFGGSFLPDRPFAPGETVTVRTDLNIVGALNGRFSFTIEQPAPPIQAAPLPVVPAGSDGIQQFRSRPDLEPAAITVTHDSAPLVDGDVFVAPQFGPVQNGPMILDPHGSLVWFDPFPTSTETLVTDFREQHLDGHPVLTWWQGNMNAGSGSGHGVILNENYQQVAAVYAGNGLQMDLHEFVITPQGQAYIIAASPVRLPGISRPVIDDVVQEIEIKTGLVLFEWHALDHIALADSSAWPPTAPGNIADPYHINSVSLAPDGNLILSLRNTSAVYEVDHATGAVIWTLGGKSSSFAMGPGTTTAFQHDAVVQADGTVTIFDDGAGPPRIHPYSRGVRIRLDDSSMTAALVSEYGHSPELSADFEGSVQTLPSGDVFLGWGQQPYFSEVDPTGAQDFDAHFNVPTASYRAYRFPWTGRPLSRPDLTAAPLAGGSTLLYASQNGATDVADWRVLAGSTPTSLRPIATSAKSGFETTIAVPGAYRNLAVQALGERGQTLSTSRTISDAQVVAITSPSSTTFTEGQPGSFTITTAGNTVRSISKEEGSLPEGVLLKDNGNGTATLSGTPAPGTAGSHPITITAANSAGPAAVQGFVLTINPPTPGPAPLPPGRRKSACPPASDHLSRRSLGAIRLGMTRSQSHTADRHSSDRRKRYEEFFCFAPIGVRAGYASPQLLHHLAVDVRREVRDRIVLILSANPRLAIDGVRCGTSFAAVARRLRGGHAFHVGLNLWYLSPSAVSTAVLKIRRGVVQEIGIADLRLTKSHKQQSPFIRSFY